MRSFSIGSLLVAAALSLSASSGTWLGEPPVFPVKAQPYGQSYAEWTASWWTWFMQHPVAGHPSIDGPFDVTSGQSGNVWFLASVLDVGVATPRTRTITVPAGKSLLLGLLNAEMSSQEGVPDEAEQRAIANFLADHIVNVECTVDDKDVDMSQYRFESPQFSFTAPTPWIFGPSGEGQSGTSVADGYFAMVRPLPIGQHTISARGSFHFDAGELGPDPFDLALDMTYVVNVQ